MHSLLFNIMVLLPLAYASALPLSSDSPLSPRDPVCTPHYNVWTTYYTSGTSPTQTTACGDHYNPSNYVAAISVELENAIGGMRPACQRQIRITDRQTGRSIVAVIQNANATGNLGKYALDLSPAAYNALGGNTNSPNDAGQRRIDWQLIIGVQFYF